MSDPDTTSEVQRTAPDRARIVRTALILAAVAVTFYIGFIAIGAMRG